MELSLDPSHFLVFLGRRVFGFVARRTGSASENVCHLFAEMDPDQPAVAIVNLSASSRRTGIFVCFVCC